MSGTQGRALKGVAQFFAAMLVCTMIARGTAGATLAVVQTASPRRGELVQGLTADAALSAGEVQNVKAPAGLVLEKYFVPAGGRVEADTPLAQFDPDGVKDALARAKTELARLRLQREKLLAGDTADTSSLSSASTQRDRAQADYNAQKAQNDAAVAAARNDADTAQSALDAANAALAELRAQTDPPASEEALAAAQGAADAAAAALAEKQAALAAAQSAADTAGENAARALADAQAALDTAAKAYEKSKQETEFQNRQNNLDAQTAALDIEKQQAVVDALAALAENGGVLKAGSAGTVETLTLEPGGTVTEAPVAALAPADAGMTATFTLDSGNAEKLAGGAALTLRQGGTAVSTTVRAISAPDENGRVTVTADVPADAGLRKTQPVTASAELSRTIYEMVLPPEAVRMDNKGSYVLRVEQTQTILGLRNVLSRVDVTVLEQSASGVAVEGPLSPQDVLVKSSARPVAAGDSVRVEQP
ncbi:hypothetical protein GMD59_08000 [Ruthenibacterium lactatiformans]|uniref:HlyD family efflux transporter periplasmic adaptor subunit n=1 Tax=Ruthenibacterium lactatiformans TaxID=1550024 RepID=A0A6L6LR70_9FIRM|nr:hypothetical protein [Ruthenibacterium lactatiformans]